MDVFTADALTGHLFLRDDSVVCVVFLSTASAVISV